MADMSAPSGQAPAIAPPIRTDDEILPYNRWVQIGKSNCSLNLDKKQSNPIFKMAVDLLMHTNFHRAFTTSTIVPSIYIQQFWATIQYDKKARNYRCQLDEQWFVLIKDILREALQITPINNTQAFVAPPSTEVLVDLFNQLGYPVSNIVTNDMFQPWRALTTIINLCLTGKTSGFECPRALVLQILWGIVTQSNIDYAERIWEEFTQSIHTFMEDKRNLYLKFSAKGTKREVFGMPIPGRLITADIQEASYYQEYQENVAKHRGFLASETGSTQDLPTPKPAKPARKPKSTAQKAPSKPSISTPVASTQPAPTSVPAKSQENKRNRPQKQLTSPLNAKGLNIAFLTRHASPEVLQSLWVSQRLKRFLLWNLGLQMKRLTIKRLWRKSWKPHMRCIGVRSHQWSSGNLNQKKYQPPPEVPGNGKAKVTKEQVAHDLLSLQKAKRKNPVEQYIFQRHNEEESKKVLTGASEGGNDDVQTGPDPDVQNEGQKETNADTLDEGQVGSNPDERFEGQAGPDPGIIGNEEQSIPNPVVHAGSDQDFQLGIESYQTQLNLTKPQWDATGFEYKHDYTVIDSPRAVIFRDKYGVQMMMRLNEIHKFSDGTLQQIDEALDYRVKEFRINRMNLYLNTRFWTKKDVDRCKAFMFAIQRRLQLRRIYCNLESFIGG
nr:monodehydroascorbate reductase [Tanacetum cinerariifolium]